jgi:hypothetical protein
MIVYKWSQGCLLSSFVNQLEALCRRFCCVMSYILSEIERFPYEIADVYSIYCRLHFLPFDCQALSQPQSLSDVLRVVSKEDAILVPFLLSLLSLG